MAFGPRMNVHQAQVALNDLLREEVQRALSASTAVNVWITKIEERLAQVSGSGISPEMMPAARALANRIRESNKQQHSDIQALAQGIREIAG